MTVVKTVEKPVKMDLDFLLNHNLEVYVRNCSQPAAQIIINVVTADGKNKTIRIPRTSLPICINDYIDATSARQSNDLRTYIRKGILALVWPDDATQELSSPDAIDELNRINQSEFSAHNVNISQRVSNVNSDPSTIQVPIEEPTTEILNPRVMDICNRLQSNDINPKAAISELKAMERDLNDQDCAYVVANVVDNSVKLYIQKVLAGFQNKIKTGPNSVNIEPVVEKVMRTGQANKTKVVINDDDEGEEKLTPEELAKEAAREKAARVHQAVK